MGKRKTNKQNSLFNEARWRNHYYNALGNIVWSMFEWKNLPKTINPFYLEKMLHTLGYIAFYDDPILGQMCVTGAYSRLNPYQEPVEFKASMVHYHRQFPLRTHLIDDTIAKEENMGVFLPNMQGATLGLNSYASSQNALDLFAHMLAENKMTFLVAQNQLKMPYIIRTDAENELSARQFVNKIQQNEAAIFVDKNGVVDRTFEVHPVHNTSTPQIIEKISIARIDIINEFLTFFGINNFATDKKERLITSEVSANNELIAHSRNKFLYPRQYAADILNRLWGTNIEVGLREDIEELIQAELGMDAQANNEMTASKGSEGGMQ